MISIWAQWCIVAVSTIRGYTREEVVFLLKQARHETGHFTSTFWASDRNMFGMSEMRNAARRERLRGVRLGPDGLYRAQFKTLLGSVLDRLDWDDQMGIKRGPGYGEAVSRKYHTSPQYFEAVSGISDARAERAYWLALASIPLTILILAKWLKIF